MKNQFSSVWILGALVFSSGAASPEAAPSPNGRGYRPLPAESVAIAVAGSAKGDPKAGVSLTSKGWSYFDSKEWDKAIDQFLSALEMNSADHSAAEGLVMALYRSGDYAAAARIGDEISVIMPGVKKILARTVTAEIRHLLHREKRDEAGKLLAHFPAADADYDEANRLLAGAAGIETALQEAGDVIRESGNFAGN
jgi:tetratricopeptide (TPR) repeat protein